MRVALTKRDLCVLDTLARRVRVLSFDQVADAFWSASPHRGELGRRRILQLVEAGYVRAESVLARPILNLTGPAVAWRPGRDAPNFAALSYRLVRRWTQSVRATRTVIATAAGAAAVGGVAGRVPRRSESTHDLHLTAVYLRMLHEDPDRAALWESEAVTAHRARGLHVKLPDAILALRPPLAIEFGGAYSARKLEAFHEHCERRQLAYEIW